MELIALLGTGKGTWGQIAGVINHGDWENIILLVNGWLVCGYFLRSS